MKVINNLEEQPVFSYTLGRFFFSNDELLMYLQDEKWKIDSKEIFEKISEHYCFLLCKPVYFEKLDIGYWDDSIINLEVIDSEVKQELENLINQFNEKLQTLKTMRWEPTNIKVIVEI